MIYINSGSFGCVFMPYLKCDFNNLDGTQFENTVGKVFSSIKDSIIEHNSNEIIKKLDPTSIFTPKYYGLCKVEYESIHDTAISKCDKFSTPSKINNAPQLIYEYGGVDFQVGNDYLKNTMTLEEFLPLWLPVFNG
jgi:hypothetical protein